MHRRWLAGFLLLWTAGGCIIENGAGRHDDPGYLAFADPRNTMSSQRGNRFIAHDHALIRAAIRTKVHTPSTACDPTASAATLLPLPAGAPARHAPVVSALFVRAEQPRLSTRGEDSVNAGGDHSDHQFLRFAHHYTQREWHGNPEIAAKERRLL